MSASLERTIEELRAATRILVGEEIIDGFGHVSTRHPVHPDRYFMLKSNLDGPSADDRVLELDADSNPVISEIRPPYSRREKTSRPFPSVPERKMTQGAATPNSRPFPGSSRTLHQCPPISTNGRPVTNRTAAGGAYGYSRCCSA